MKHNIGIILAILSFVSTVLSCTNRPENILPPSKMEDVLYDYHIAQALAGKFSRLESDSVWLYFEAVYKKHNISEADFDSSLVYYNRHPKELKDIYNRVEERFSIALKDIQIQIGSNEMMAYAQGSDTARICDIWKGEHLYIFHGNNFQNKESFIIKADSNIHRNDKFSLITNVGFISANQDNANNNLTICLTIKMKDGTIYSETRGDFYRNRGDNEKNQIDIETNDNKDIESISGFFYYENKNQARSLAYVSNIHLLRTHTQKQEKQIEDTIPTYIVVQDSSQALPLSEQVHEVHTSKELRQMSIEKVTKKENVHIVTLPEINRKTNRRRR